MFEPPIDVTKHTNLFSAKEVKHNSKVPWPELKQQAEVDASQALEGILKALEDEVSGEA